jgi:ubiquitin carboxyl-terminal hydrolase 14
VVAPSSSAAAAPAAAGSSATPMEVEEPKPAEPVDMAVVEGAGCDNKTARYELFAIITHQGRTAEGGHYVAWVKKDKTKWLVFDDETVAEFPADRIKELHGGGDFHMAYMCFYRKMDGLTLD